MGNVVNIEDYRRDSISIRLPDDDEPSVSDQVIEVVARDANVFQRNGRIVQVARRLDAPDFADLNDSIPSIIPMMPGRLRELVAKYFRFFKLDAKGNEVLQQCPLWLTQALLARPELPDVRPLTGVVTYPAMRPDGTFIVKPGYDSRTGIWYEGDPIVAPECPSEQTARDAAASLFDLVSEFPFVNAAHRATWLAYPLTIIARYAIDTAPVWVFDAPTPGSGKTLLAALAGRIVTGTQLPRMAPSKDNPEEDRKLITALAMSGESVVLIDNLEGPFGGAAFDAAVTATEWSGRVLGESRIIKAPLRITWAVTGNNVSIRGDMQRRVIHCRVDAEAERPEERKFKRSQEQLFEMADSRRAEYLEALVTILRFGMASERKPIVPWGSFERWSHVVRQSLAALSLGDPAESRDAFRKESDVQHETRGILLKELRRLVIIGGAQTARSLVGGLSEEGREALGELTNKKPKECTGSTLGYLLRKLKGRPILGYTAVDGGKGTGNQSGTVLWDVKSEVLEAAE